MQIGSNTPDTSRFKKRKRIRDLQNGERWVFRAVAGPVHQHFHMWPTIEEDAVTHVMKPTWRSVCVRRDERNMLDTLAEIDTTLKMKFAERSGLDPKDNAHKSMLRKNDRFDYACFFRNSETPIELTILEVNWSVHDQIMQIKQKKDAVKPDMLFYGLPFMFDLMVEKRKNPKTGRPDYGVDVCLPCRTAGQIPMKYLDQKKEPFPNMAQFFTAEELEVINAFPELETIDKILSADEVKAKLIEFPIDLGRRKKNEPTAFIFFHEMPDILALQQNAVKTQIPVILPTQADLAGIGAGAPALPPSGASAPDARKAVDAQFTVENGAPVAEKVPPVREQPAGSAATSAPVSSTPAQPAPAAAGTVSFTPPGVAATPPVQNGPLNKPKGLW